MERYQIKPDSEVELDQWDPNETEAFDGSKDEGAERLDELNGQLEELQELLYAEHRHRVLIVLQGMDTSGKDGTIRHVFEGVNPQGVRVASFKVPSQEELDHDYLWRIHKQVPGKGEMVIFNRSHYEDVLVVRVHELAPKEIWSRRFDQINHFERMLAEEGTTILKFYLHIDQEEQRALAGGWMSRTSAGNSTRDLEERELWGEYLKAYDDVLSKTSTNGPLVCRSGDRKWYRNLSSLPVFVKTLKGLNMKYLNRRLTWIKSRSNRD
jgi:PPK2 family polyphosphate:nucleotide phosphotransferase